MNEQSPEIKALLQTDEEFNTLLGASIESIYQASRT